MDPANTSRDVDADRGYLSEEREAWLNANGDRNRILRRGLRNRIAKPRARGEHAFAAIEQRGAS
jgi:hypothetical protein